MTKKPVKIKDVMAIAREAGEAVMQIAKDAEGKNVDAIIDSKADDSPVTKGDKAANEIVKKRLQALTPDIPILSEEDTAEEMHNALNSKRYWAVDPIDGTRTYVHYLKGKKERDGFAVHIGLIEEGKPTKGVVYFPARDEIYYTGDDNKAYRQSVGSAPKELHAAKLLPTDEVLNLSSSFRKEEQLDALFDKSVHSIPAIGGERILLAADGRNVDAPIHAAHINRNYNFWDGAAAHAILRKAGGDIVTVSDFTMNDLSQSELVRYKAYEGLDPAQAPQSIAAHADTLVALGFPKEKLASREIS